MKSKLFFFLILIIYSCSQSPSSTVDDEALIRKMMSEEVTASWEKNDNNWILANYTDDADAAFITGNVFSGKKNLPLSNGSIPQGRKFIVTLESIRFISPDVAIVNNNAHFTGGVNDKGEKLPDSRDAGTFILKKSEGKWKVAALRVLPMRNDPEQVKKDISQALAAFATGWKNNDAKASIQYFTEDAINYRPNAEPDNGKAAILTMSEGFLKSFAVKELEFKNLELDVYGDHAYEMGTFNQNFVPKDGSKALVQIGRYHATWRYDGDGQWRMKKFLFNTMDTK